MLRPALAGVVVALAGAGWALAADALTFAVSALLLLRLPAIPAVDHLEMTPFVARLREAWREFVKRDWVWGIVLGASLGNACLVLSGYWARSLPNGRWAGRRLGG